MRNLRTAFGLLTTLPFGMPENWLPGDSGRSGIWFPLVGIVIGGLTWLVWCSTEFVFPAISGWRADSNGMGCHDWRPAS